MDIFEYMHSGAIVLTPNNRLSNQLLQDFFIKYPDTVHIKPNCIPYTTFLRHMFQTIKRTFPDENHPLLLTPLQEYDIWRKILKTNSINLLHEVAKAWEHSHIWALDIDHSDFLNTKATLQFQTWYKAFSLELRNLEAITEAQLVDYIIKFIKKLPLQTYIWFGFSELNPAQKLLQNHSYKIINTEWQKKNILSFKYEADDRKDEYETLIAWLKTRLKTSDARRIGIVIPDLQEQSNRLQRTLEKHFSPEEYDLSLGIPLINHPLISHAFAWLNLDITNINHDISDLLLTSPYLKGSYKELLARAECLQNTPFENHPPILSKILSSITIFPAEASPKDWIYFFKNRLLELGFPGELALNSACYQHLQRFMSILDSLLELTLTSQILPQKTALNILKYLLTTTIFQIQKPTRRIQIMGLLEAAGCSFDSIWVTNLTDQCLPQKTKLSAFIPATLQRTYKMPHSLATLELVYACQLINKLQQGSNLSIFSYPKWEGEIPSLISPLIKNFDTFCFKKSAKNNFISKLENISEDYILPLAAAETNLGTSTLLANQAKCPFKAFAAHRLHARPALELKTGLSPLEKGQILHKALEKTWQEIPSQKTLNNLTESNLNLILKNAIRSACSHIVPNFIKEIEEERLFNLLSISMQWERQREPFSIYALEKSFKLNLAGLEFNIRVDRIDLVDETNTKWIIDYKTTLPQPKPWFEERPLEPQILLYALIENNISALVYLQLKAAQCLSSSCNNLNINQYHKILSNLAAEFFEGLCEPKPANSSICKNCDFQSLCRISH